MSTATDPLTGAPLPETALQRILFLSPKVHVYNIPPLPSTKGHQAALWTADPSRHIFSARVRVVETSHSAEDDESESDTGTLSAAVLLEDPATNQLFAAAPYTSEKDVEPVTDSSRFFAVTVRDPSGKRAVLGIGFEERAEAFDFGVALQEVHKGILGAGGSGGGSGSGSKQAEKEKERETEKRDLSLKEGETITVSFGGKFGRRRKAAEERNTGLGDGGGDLSAFSLPPPPGPPASSGEKRGGSISLPPPFGRGGGGGQSSAPPPPSSGEDSRDRKISAEELGFDDGKFGEFA